MRCSFHALISRSQFLLCRPYCAISTRRLLHSPSITMQPVDEDSLRKALADKQSSVDLQGKAVRQLKASGASKPDIDAAVQALNALKLEKASIESQLKSSLSGAAGGRDAFRQAVANTLERRLFYIPSFKIYGGVTGLYDYGPPGCAIKANVLSFWRQVSLLFSFNFRLINVSDYQLF